MLPRYRAGVENAQHGSALPYGFTLTVWGSGQVLIDHRGQPAIGMVFLFVAGAAAAWGVLRLASREASADPDAQLESSPHVIRTGAIHVAAIGGAIGAAALVGNIDSGTAWPLGGFAAVTVYFCVTAIEMSVRELEESTATNR